jgi:hypothetical protein
MLPKVVLKFHPEENIFPENANLLENIARCSKCEIPYYLYQGRQYMYVEYQFNYEANGAIGCGHYCFPRAKCLGFHEGDQESIIMLLDGCGRVEHVYFRAHGRGQGTWKSREECEFDQHDNLITYVARGSHAFYASPGVKWRAFGFANDRCSTRGIALMAFPTEEHDDYYEPPLRSITKFEMLCCLPCLGS